MTDEGFAGMLRRELADWEAFGVLPALEKVRLIAGQAGRDEVEDCELAFLWFTFAAAIAAIEDDDEREELDHELGELSIHLAELADLGRSPLDEWLPIAWDLEVRPLVAGTFVLADRESVVGHARLRVGPDQSRALYGTVSLNADKAVEIGLVAGGHCTITRLPDGHAGQLRVQARLHQLVR
jgi:hypothetical protein